jgi:MFS family permease
VSNRPDDGPGSGRIYYGWWVVLASALGAGVSHSSVALLSFGVLLKPLSGEFGWDRAQVSLAVSLATLVIALGTPALGRLVDRVGERRVLLPAMALYAVFFGALSQLTGSLWQFYALFILAAIAGIGSNSVVYTRAITSWFDRRRGLALGLAMAGVGLAAAAIPPLTQSLIDRFGWRGAYIGFGLIVLACLPIVAFLMRRPPSVERSSRAAPIDDASEALRGQDGLRVADVMRTRVFWTLGCSFALAAIAIHGCTVHLIPLLTDRGISPQSAAGAMSLFGLGMLAGRIAAGYLMDRLFAPRVAAAFFAGPLWPRCLRCCWAWVLAQRST